MHILVCPICKEWSAAYSTDDEDRGEHLRAELIEHMGSCFA